MSELTAGNHSNKVSRTPLGVVKKILVLGRPRTWFFSYFACLAGLAMGSQTPSLFVTVVALVLFSVTTAATNQLNAYTDRDEDEENLPGRVSMVDYVGPTRLRNVALGSFMAVVFVAFWLDTVFGVVMTVAALDCIFYSMPPLRLKARPLASLMAFSGAFGFPLVAGYLLTSPTISLPPIVAIMTFWFFTYGAVKNLPDYHGDKEAGLRTPATIFDTRRDAVVFAAALLLTPFPLILGAALSGLIATKYLLLLVFLLFLVYLLKKTFDSDTAKELEIAHTDGFFYAVSVSAVFFLLQTQSLRALALAAAPFALLGVIEKAEFDSR